MFEAHVLHLLRKYLGEYVEGLSTEALRISVWNGDVVLKDLKLKAEALNSLKLPVTVKAGFVGTITLKVPWKSLGKEPVVVLIDRVFVLAHPAPAGQTLKEEDREKIFEAKLQQIEDDELATLEAINGRSKAGTAPGGNSWLGSLIATIIGNLKVTISHVHIRYEDSISNLGHPFCSGVTLSKLAAVTTDEHGNETFDTSGALDKLCKSLQLQRLAVYHDTNSIPWKVDKNWEDLDPSEWTQIFQDGIDEVSREQVVSIWAMNRKYLVSPINGVLIYHRLGKQERRNPEIPFEKASLVLSDVSLTITEAQYYDGIKLLETCSRYKTRVDVSHLRPVVPVSEDRHAWWHYAMLASLQQKKMCYWFSWERIKHLCQLRRSYVQMYANSLQQVPSVEISELRKIERVLDSKVILLWRLLAHARIESAKSKEASKQKNNLKRSWWNLGWRTAPGDDSDASVSPESRLAEEERLTKEEWQAVNKMLSYQQDDNTTYLHGKDLQNMVQFLVDVSVGQAAARIISIDQTEIVCGRFEELHVRTKMYHKCIHCDVSLKFYGLSSPEGSLTQSVISETKTNAVEASFVYLPVGEDVDWRLSATIAPCHATVLMKSYERFLEFVKRSNAVSPTVAMETATALQMKIEQVTRRAQEQLQLVLEEQSRFALDVDFDAPKVRIPVKAGESESQFILDFGHFTLYTREGQPDERRQSLYSRFYISGRDMAAFFIDGTSKEKPSSSLDHGSQMLPLHTLDDAGQFYSLLDRCGMSVIVDQIKIPHPSYPSTRVSVQVPNLGIHISPKRYCRVMELLNIFYSTMEIGDEDTSASLQPCSVPWLPADLATDARILVWRGIGYTLAEWKPCYLVLSGLYLYVLESEASQTYQRCCSMAGRQVFEVSPASVGGSLYAVSVSSRGSDVQKALESTSTLIIELHDSEEKTAWLKELVQATYRASAPPTIDILGEQINCPRESIGPRHSNLKSADLVVNGSLVETKLYIYGKSDEKCGNADQELIIEILACGGKVNVLRLGGDLTVKMKLQTLKIKDELQSRLSRSPQYLACSVFNENKKPGSCTAFDLSKKAINMFFLEEDDTFKDALPDFMSVSDQSFYSSELICDLSSPDLCERYTGIGRVDASSHKKDQVKGKVGEIFYEAADSNVPDFVCVTFLTRSSGSPLYDGIDTQMCIRMSALEFFCNRPTLVALLGFGFDLSLASSAESQTDGMVVPKCTEKKEENSRSLVTGLLGYGKGRVVFNLRMDVDSVCVFLNKEDGSQLAMFVQENFILDLKVHPSSTSIEGTLGNMRLCDMSLGPDHHWGWLCDIRNQGFESLIKFKFQSYSVGDDDYEGYDYSLTGRLSAVRIVFLYRFVLEITTYFMELASPHTEEAIKLVDKVGGFEWLIQKYEMDGAAAVKVDLSLDTPIIIVPKNSTSEDYMQLDLGQLQVKNNFSWHGCKESDPSAVHLDILDAEIHGINMAVGVGGHMGKPLIREGQGIHIQVRRSLRDVFRKVPTISIEVKVGLLHCVMSDKEYNVIVNCVYLNLSEQPRLPPSFRSSATGTKESMRMLVDKVNPYGQKLLARTIVVIAVEVDYALLELCNGFDEESPLAQILLEGLWVLYRTTSMFEMDLYVSIPKFSILDIRPDTKPEMRLMLGSYVDISKPGLYSASGSSRTGRAPSVNDCIAENLESASDMDVSNLTMLVMDYRWRSSFQSFVIRVQQPRVLVVLDFLLAVAEFFVPWLGAITGREESLHSENDPLTSCDDIILSEPVYMQQDDVVRLSPRRQLIVDGFGTDEFIYDGCGGTITLIQEIDTKGQSHSGTIIVIGRGKKLRFKNVKIENGALLRKCIYLSNDSSYSVSVDEGVEISLLENISVGSDIEGLEQYQGCTMQESDSNMISGDNSSQLRNVTFEAQVMSSELTFYDSSKLSSDNTMHAEKLLRVKMDLSFMYASKENDTWARSLVKDLTIEAGSGLVILEPVDISGGYTSVKDKTNISVISTDICIHLPLSVASLILLLQEQATVALQFGNANPLASCTNFKRVWVSPKVSGDLPCYSLTFWRPQAPSNYAILGDCVTSRSIPPSQVVVAVSNTYGRVRKPIGFKLIGSFSKLQGMEEQCRFNSNLDCSIWMPIPPPGYLAMGCVAHVGSQPPPTHIVYCLRSDLAASACFSDCMFYVPPNSSVSSGFSIWNVDNVAGSFYAITSVDFPPKFQSFDLHQILLHNHNRQHLMTNHSSSNTSIDKDLKSQQEADSSSGTSGWDILRTLSKSGSCYMSTPQFERVWWDRGCDLRKPISIWRPIPRPGFAALADCITEGLEPPGLGLVFKCDNSVISAKPVQFTKVAQVNRKGVDEAFFWYPIPPPGYASIGCVVTRTDEAPNKDTFCCPRIDLVTQANISDQPISRSSTLKGSNSWSIWKIENQAYTFLARSDHRKPSSRLAYNISDYIKPRTRENVSAELKLECLSLSVLDSFCGTMTPLIDTTVANINLASHGRMEAMNAVLICSFAASTFNRQLEEWEPLVEPFDGIFKLETYDISEHHPSKVGKRVRIAATSTLNVNVSAANLETLIELVASWQRQNIVDPRLPSEEGDENEKNCNDLSFSALEEDDFQKVTVENKMGCDIYLRKVEQVSDNVILLPRDNEAQLLIPPPRFSDRLNVVAKSRETRFYVAVEISESKDLPIVDDGNSHDFFCALRVLIDSKVSDQCKLFPQSARTRCVRPSISKIDGLNVGHAKWNELFIFEVPEKGLANLEVEVTNLALKAGKGEVVGALSIPIGTGAVTLKRAASIRVLQQAAATDLKKISQYPLRKKGQLISNEDKKNCGTFILSTSYFERSAHVNFHLGTEDTVDNDRDVGFWVGLSPYGPWESFGSMLPLSVVPKSLDKKPFAFEVVMRNGKKHAILRALAVIVNGTDVKLEVSVCPASISNSLMNVGSSSTPLITEEIFENEQYLPVSGWGKKSGFHINDPGRWSTRDLSYSSKDFFEPALPSGWKWTSAWKLDKSMFVDGDGWAYGADFQNLKWPLSSSEFSSQSPLDCVRRRRWIRTRQKLPDVNINSMRNVIAVINPGSSEVLPWMSMAKEADMCLQVRPYAKGSQEAYTWSQIVTLNSCKDQISNQKAAPSWQNAIKNLNVLLPNSVLKLDKLEKKDMLMYCNPTTNTKQNFWLSVGTDTSVLHTELNAPIFDWKISINATIKLENKLPYEAEYAIWEKKVEGNTVERQHGIVSAGGSAFIYNADLRRPIYLTLFVQGGWVLEEDAILIMDVPATGRTSFWMIQQQTKRRLRVSVEYDMGGSDAAPKTLRLFVPYWLCNDSSIPLSYRVVEVDTLDNAGTDSQTISKAVKSAKFALRHSSKSIDRKFSTSRRNLQILEVIEDFCSNCVMLSPHDYTFPSGSAPYRDDILSSNRVGISVAVHHSEYYSAGISLLELERKERVDVKAFAADGSYFNLSAQLKMDSDRTKVVHFLPRALIINKLGRSVSLCQCNTELAEWVHPNDPPKLLKWKSSARNELLKLRLDGHKWSTPFSIQFDGIMCVYIKTDKGNDQMHIKVEVRGGTKSSRYEVVIQPASLSSPYRIENLSTFLPIRFRQVDGMDDSWLCLPPNSAASFYWEDLGRRRLLEVLADGMDPLKSEKYNIDEVMDHQPLQSSSGPMRALRLTVLKEGKVQICRISDWMPDNETPAVMHGRVPSPIIHPSQNDYKQSSFALESEFHITFELAELGLSIIDHMPEEILYFSIQNLLLSYSSGLDSGISRFKLRMLSIQIDNQLPFTQMPVLFGPVTMGDQLDYILKFSVTMQRNNSLDFCVYPYLGLQVPESSSFLVNIHEPIIWRLHEMFNQVNFGSIFGSTPSAVSVDPIIKIGLFNISEIRFKVTMAMSPAQRPRGVLGFWSSLMTALGNTEHMPVRIAQRFREEVCMRQSALISTAILNVQKDLLSQPLQLLSGVDILGNASSALSNMSKGVAALSMDKKFIQSRQKQDSKGIEDIGDVIREGGGAVAKGLFRGLTGIVTKPYEGAISSGVEGFVQGVGKGLIGAAAQPVSGVLDFLSKTTEGANAVRMKIASAITSEEKLLRRRLPRVISGDNLLRPYDEYKATGQVILQMAESGAFPFQVDLFKVRGKFALSDAYEDHFMLRKGKILLITHRRILLLQQPINIIGQRKFSPAIDRCSVIWDVLLEDLATMELTHGKKDYPGSPPSHLILYLQSRSLESKVNARVVKCIRGSQQAHEIFSSIEQTLKTYGPNDLKIVPKRKVPRPYTPSTTVVGHEIMPKEVFGMWSVQEDQKSVPMNSVFGAIFAQPQRIQVDPK